MSGDGGGGGDAFGDMLLRMQTNYNLQHDEIIVSVNDVYPMVRQLVDAEPTERWLIWCEHSRGVNRATVELAHRRLAAITGRTVAAVRYTSVRYFKSGEIDTLVVTLMSMSCGVDLTPCRRNVFVNPSAHTWRERNQAIARTDRPPQAGDVKTYFVYGLIT